MNTPLNPEEIRQLLNRSAERIEPSVLSKLTEARSRALAAQKVAAIAPTLAGEKFVAYFRPQEDHRLLYLGMALILILTLFSSTSYWEQISGPDDDELDIAILTDELPIEVYVD